MQNLLERWLEPLFAAPFSTEILNSALKDYSQPNFKAHRLVKEGKLIRLKRGLFYVNPVYSKVPVNHFVIANNLYEGTSYVSCESALAYYGLIPERVMGVTSVVTGRSKEFSTALGWFRYSTIADALFPLGIRSINGCLIASPEKALCDYLYFKKDLRISSPKALASYLEEDVRFDFDSFAKYNHSIIADYASAGYKRELFKALERLFP